MGKAVLITSHFLNSKRKAGFHNIADALLKKGYEVLFLTGNASYIHHLKSDYRAALINSSKLNKMVKSGENLKQFIRFTKLHPVNYRNKILNKIFLPSVKKYANKLNDFVELNDFIMESELFIFESFPGLLWFEHFKKLNKKAKFVYRVSDDMRQLNKHPFILEHEDKIISKFDLVSVPSDYFLNLFKNRTNIKLHYHGVRKDLFDQENKSPYKKSDNFKFVFTGNAYLDYDFINTAATVSPEDEYHIIGPLKKINLTAKISFYGEMPFEDTLPFIKFADAGLHTLKYSAGAESFSDSLKVLQYTYCRLPVLAPEYMKSGRNNFIFYKPGDKDSIRQAIGKAKEYDKNKTDISNVYTWDVLTDKILNE